MQCTHSQAPGPTREARRSLGLALADLGMNSMYVRTACPRRRVQLISMLMQRQEASWTPRPAPRSEAVSPTADSLLRHTHTHIHPHMAIGPCPRTEKGAPMSRGRAMNKVAAVPDESWPRMQKAHATALLVPCHLSWRCGTKTPTNPSSSRFLVGSLLRTWPGSVVCAFTRVFLIRALLRMRVFTWGELSVGYEAHRRTSSRPCLPCPANLVSLCPSTGRGCERRPELCSSSGAEQPVLPHWE